MGSDTRNRVSTEKTVVLVSYWRPSLLGWRPLLKYGFSGFGCPHGWTGLDSGLSASELQTNSLGTR